MSNAIKILPGPHAEGATIVLPGRAGDDSDKPVTLKAPGYPPEVKGECSRAAQGNDLLIHIPSSATRDFEPGAGYKIEIPELRVTGDIEVWPQLPTTGKTYAELEAEAQQHRNNGIPTEGEKNDPVVQPVTAPAHVEPVVVEPVLGLVSASFWSRLYSIRKFLFAGGGVLASILALAVWFVVHGHHASPPSAPFRPATPVPPVATTVPVTAHQPVMTPPPASPVNILEGLSVPAVIAQAGSASAIGDEGQRRLTHGKPDDGVLLLEAAAQRGDGHAMARLAHLYDPTAFDPNGPVPAADIRESSQYYRAAVQAGDEDVKDDRARLHDHLEKKASAGDMEAQLALKDFWP
ncbi:MULTISPECIES: DUF3597 domain-containing protein [Acetobacter]|jgi:hypothetical protein|uniref:Uncharacterized protein n=1 Tax=Acetobacter lovaniensis TaxID=104100 RepID=A0A841QJE7_9PROT|nr:DUF3597 domain-containing protein [Acetobacter lovaniensis]MBB6458536.1 hypothetical protein [Acetobacter lovaniensis]MCI1795355.1 hypothetical protein [Acetobacter lovaniensis]MCP1240710.1 hypothetical protein [Acetobacter lovaniensis]NHN82737.1 hypothetical protein [Acetobacter lovaniensis]